MAQRSIHVPFFFLIALACYACSMEFRESGQPQTLTSTSWRCELPPATFQEIDLVGTWQTDFRSAESTRVDTLILLQNGKYRQFFSNSTTNYQYESDWQNWRVENLVSGGAYVYFEGMKFCGGVTGTCIDPQNVELGFYEFCGDRWFELNSEFSLTLVGDVTVPRAIRLRHMRPSGYETYFVNYTLVDN